MAEQVQMSHCDVGGERRLVSPVPDFCIGDMSCILYAQYLGMRHWSNASTVPHVDCRLQSHFTCLHYTARYRYRRIEYWCSGWPKSVRSFGVMVPWHII